MDIRTILVSIDAEAFSPALVNCAGKLAQRFGARLVGIAAAEPTLPYGALDGAVAITGAYAADRADLEARLGGYENDFRALVPHGIEADYRVILEPPTQSVVAAARSADLIVTGSHLDEGAARQRALDPGEVVLTAGRPVLMVGAGVSEINAKRIVVGWTDRREARRAVADALPFLEAASEVAVITVSEGDAAEEQASLADLIAWLARHGVRARGAVRPSKGEVAATLAEAAAEHEADLIITGGYGHSRLRQWLLGGMTQQLLASAGLSRFMSN